MSAVYVDCVRAARGRPALNDDNIILSMELRFQLTDITTFRYIAVNQEASVQS